MPRWCLAVCCCLAFLSIPALTASAQETTATITGTVTDQSGGVLPGVVVSVKHVATGRTFDATTSGEGNYLVTLLPVGGYEITFTLQGFQQKVIRGVTLAVNDRAKVDMQLAPGGVSEVVEVTGRALPQTTTAVQELIDSTRVQELPINNRNFAKLAELAPGVSSDLPDEVGVGLTSTMSLSVNGARRNAINWLVDGVMNVDVGSNITLLSTPTLESIEQFKIITSSYAAEWPRSGGGIINVVTKSGTSKFAGSGYEFFRNDGLNSNSYFRKQSTDPAIRDNPPYLRYNNFGFTVGGPATKSKDKLFFFYSEEFRRITRAPASLTATVPNPDWLTDPTNANYVPPAERDPIAVKLLSGYPTPNTPPLAPGAVGRYQVTSPNINNTRQEVIRVDYDLSSSQRLWGRYTHDLSQTRELGGLFFSTAIPGVAGTDTNIPGQVAAFGVRSIIGSSKLNELNVHFSSNNITTQPAEGVRNTKAAFGVTIPEVFPDNAAGLIPVIDVSGLSTLGANQLYRIQYLNTSVTDNFSWQRGNHAYKFGGLATFEQKNENAASRSQGGFSFVAAGTTTAFQNFLRGNANGVCTGCSYTEAERDIDLNLRFNRFEFYAQDTWRPTARLTVDYGVRYALYPPITEKNNQLVTFDPSVYRASQAPPFANATGTLIDRTQGNLLDGIIQGGVNSPYGDGIYKFQKDAIQPRAGFAYDMSGHGSTVLRGAFGIYYDQPLVGIFEQNSFTMPPIVNNVTFTNPTLSNPASGQTPTTTGVRTIIASATDFKNPRTSQWNVGVTRRFASRITGEVSYVGSRGDNLIRPTDINYPDPAKVVALQNTIPGAVNAVRPYQSYGAITMRETTARSRYHGLLSSAKIDAGKSASVTLNYTLSRNQTDATNDRDGVDIPQDPSHPERDYADARTDRRHIFNGSFVYEVPFYRNSPNALAKAVVGGWQVAGIVNISSGQPVSRILVLSDTFRRGIFADLVGDPNVGTRFVNGVPYWFNPDAFAPPAAGTFGNSGRAPFRQPGRHQWDINLSKNFYPTDGTRLQFRAEFINAFDQRQWLADPTVGGLDNTCTFSNTSCNVAGDRFGQIIATRAAREIQLGLKLYW